jgi:hypothetical protein
VASGKEHILIRSKSIILLAVVLTCFSTGCNPDAALNAAFAKFGLTRLAVLRNDIQPGAVFVSSSKAAVFADNLWDYVPNSTLQTQYDNQSKTISGYLPQISSTRNIEPKAALQFISSIIPVDAAADVKFSNSVSVKQLTCLVSRVPIVDINGFISAPANLGFSSQMKAYFDAHYSIFVAYEVWKSSDISFDSSSGADVTASLNIGQVKPVKTASASFALQRTTKESLTITGGQPYAFAVKLVKIVRDSGSGNLKLQITGFHSPTVLQGPEDQYVYVNAKDPRLSYSIVPKGQRLAALTGE